MSRPDGGILVPVADLTSAFTGLKVRTAGFLTDYEVHSGRGRLKSGQAELSVDLNLVLKGNALGELPLQSKMMMIGSIDIITGTKTIILVAICAIPVQELDIKLWEQAARKLSQALHNADGAIVV